jgi:hypothetical protein
MKDGVLGFSWCVLRTQNNRQQTRRVMKFVPTPRRISIKETRRIECSKCVWMFACRGWNNPFKRNESAEQDIIKWSTFDCMLSAYLGTNLMCSFVCVGISWPTERLWVCEDERFALQMERNASRRTVLAHTMRIVGGMEDKCHEISP